MKSKPAGPCEGGEPVEIEGVLIPASTHFQLVTGAVLVFVIQAFATAFSKGADAIVPTVANAIQVPVHAPIGAIGACFDQCCSTGPLKVKNHETDR